MSGHALSSTIPGVHRSASTFFLPKIFFFLSVNLLRNRPNAYVKTYFYYNLVMMGNNNNKIVDMYELRRYNARIVGLVKVPDRIMMVWRVALDDISWRSTWISLWRLWILSAYQFSICNDIRKNARESNAVYPFAIVRTKHSDDQ